MCFVLYVASDHPIPEIPWDSNARAVHAGELTDIDREVAKQFDGPYVKYVGSNLHCGCGFRNTLLANGNRSEFEVMGSISDEDKANQVNHFQLHDLLAAMTEKESAELYGCWHGDFADPAAEQMTIRLAEILEETFYFHERCHYHFV